MADHMLAAQKALGAGHPEQAIEEFKAVLQIDKNNEDARSNLGVLQYFAGRWADAADNLRVAVAARPSQWRIKALLGITEKRLGHSRRAVELLGESFDRMETSPVRVQAGLELLDVHYAGGNLSRAALVADSLQRIAPSNADVLYAVYRLHSDLANQARDTLAETAPESGRMHQIMAQHLINQGDLLGALGQYEKALQADPKLAGVHFELGQTILDSSSSPDTLDRAEKELKAALAENPADANAEYQLGRLYGLRDEFPAARRHYTRAIELQPDHLPAHVGLSQVLISQNEPADALTHLQAANRLDPTNAAIHFRLANAYRQLGRKEEAERELAEFQRLRQQDEKLQHVLSEMHQRVPAQHEPVPEAP